MVDDRTENGYKTSCAFGPSFEVFRTSKTWWRLEEKLGGFREGSRCEHMTIGWWPRDWRWHGQLAFTEQTFSISSPGTSCCKILLTRQGPGSESISGYQYFSYVLSSMPVASISEIPADATGSVWQFAWLSWIRAHPLRYKDHLMRSALRSTRTGRQTCRDLVRYSKDCHFGWRARLSWVQAYTELCDRRR